MGRKHSDVFKADTDDKYYRREDLQWACEPSDDDPGISEPKPGAVPRDRETGEPLEEE